MKNYNDKYTKKENDVLELITHLILTKPVAVKKLLAKHGVVFSFKPKRKDLINEIIELLGERNALFNKDLERLLAIHLENKGLEIMALESHRALFNQADEDEFLGGLIGGVAKGALGALGGMFGGGKKSVSSGGGGGNAAAAAAAANAARAKAEMDARMRQMEADRRRQQQEADRRRREAEDRRRREREEADRRRREEEDRRRRAEMNKSVANKGDGKSGNNNMMIIGGIAAVVIIGGVVLLSANKKPVVVTKAA